MCQVTICECSTRTHDTADSSYKDGKLIQHDVSSVSHFWKNDSVAFLSESREFLLTFSRLQLYI